MTIALPQRGSGPFDVLDRNRTIATAGFNRWLVPPAALAIHLCIGMAYGFSVFWLPLSRAIGISAPVACPPQSGLLDALFTTSCDWNISDMGWMFTLFFVVLGSSAALWGGWLERAGPRKAGFVAALCWSGGFLVSAFGIYVHQLWLMWVGSGLIGGIGLGLGYISPVSTLLKWFPDRRGMATGMAIMGFGGGALIGSPLADALINHFKSAASVGVWETFVVLAAIYFVFMTAGAFGYRLPPAGWRPEDWTPPVRPDAMITTHDVHLHDAHKTPQFWLIWLVLTLNVSAGIGIIGLASPMLQEIFGGQLFGRPDVPFVAFDDSQKVLAAAVGAGFVGLFSLFNIAGRFFWAALSDIIGRKSTYYCFFVIGALLYGFTPEVASLKYLGLFAAMFCVIASMYGGGFSTVPAYLADMFGTQFVGAIHGRLLTAWSTAGIVGPVVVNYMREALIADQVPRAHVYDDILWVLTAMLIAGFVCNFLIRPVAPKWYMKPDEVAALQDRRAAGDATASGSYGIGRGGLTLGAVLAWSAVGIPLAWGIWVTLENSIVLFS
jgi:MFS family permease